MTQNELDQMLHDVISEARDAGIPVPSIIDPHVMINKRPKKRFGCCKRTPEGFQIEVSAFILEGDKDAIRNTLAHEILHTCKGCDNHGKIWKSYAERMNRAYGYRIQRTSTFEAMGLQEPAQAERHIKYVMVCQRCGKQYPRERFTCVMKKINAYRCNCGGKLAVYEVKRQEELV